MTDPTIAVYRKGSMPKPLTYIGECCREWPLAVGVPVGRCGICDEYPSYKRDDTHES